MDLSNRISSRVIAATMGALIVAGGTAAPAVAVADVTPVARPATAASPWKVLLAKAKKQGNVPVIIELDLDGGRPNLAKLEKRKAETNAARANVLSELGRGKDKVDDFGALPIIALTATPRELAILQKSAHVRSVSEDREFALDVTAHEGDARPTGKARPSRDGVDLPEGSGTAGTTSLGAGAGVQNANFWDYYRIGVDKAAAAGRVGSGQVVAILDTGVESNHPWLAGDVVREACYASRVVGATSGDCPNGRTAQTGAGAARPCPWTGCAHGTHVAHTAAGLYGVASGARIIAVQVFHWTPDGPRTWESDYIRGLSYVYSLRGTYAIAAANLSIGGGGYLNYCDNQAGDGTADPTFLTGWINALAAVNIATVVSSGNNDYTNAVSHPACISGAISVGNTTLDASGYDAVLGYTTNGSNSNKTLDLLAPGTDICSAVPGARYECDWYGTSMAAPHVAGAIAVLKQKRPGATVGQLLSALGKSGPAVYDSRNGISRIRINVYAALSYI
jgi:subtilisin family serine protease